MRPLCNINEIPDGGAYATEDVLQSPVVLIRRADQVWAYLNQCPHFSIPLDFEPGVFCTYETSWIMCAHHSAMFRFEDGVCVDGPCEGAALTRVEVEVRDGCVFAR